MCISSNGSCLAVQAVTAREQATSVHISKERVDGANDAAACMVPMGQTYILLYIK